MLCICCSAQFGICQTWADITLGQEHHIYERYDSAIFYFDRAIGSSNPSLKLRGLSEKVLHYTRRKEVTTADSLWSQASTLRALDIDEKTLLYADMIDAHIDLAHRRTKTALAGFEQIESIALQHHWDSIQIEALLSIGWCNLLLSDFQQGLEVTKKAQQLSELVYADGPTHLAKAYSNLGVMYIYSSSVDSAVIWLEKSSLILKEAIGWSSETRARTLTNLSTAYSANGMPKKSADALEASLLVFEEKNNIYGLSMGYYNLAIAQSDLGDIGSATRSINRAIDNTKKLYGDNNPALSLPYQIAGILADYTGDTDLGIEFYKRSIAMKLNSEEFEDYPTGVIYQSIAQHYRVSGQLDSALVYIEKAERVYINSDGGGYGAWMMIHHNIKGGILLDLKRHREAKSYYEKSIAVTKDLKGESNFWNANNLSKIALVDAKDADWASGDMHTNEALDMIKAEDGYVMDIYSAWVLYDNLHYLYAKYLATSKKEVLDEFTDALYKYLNHNTKFRNRYTDEFTKRGIIKEVMYAYSVLIELCHNLYLKTQDKKFASLAFQIEESIRAAILKDVVNEDLVKFHDISDEIREQEQELTALLMEASEAYIEQPDVDSIQQEFERAKLSHNDFVNKEILQHPAYYQYKYGAKISSIDDIRSHLKINEGMVQFLKGDSSYFAICIADEKSDFIKLGPVDEIDSLTQLWRSAISNPNNKGWEETGVHLYNLIWLPLNNFITTPSLKVLPTSLLWYVNLEALPVPDQDLLLIDKYNIRYSLSSELELLRYNEKTSYTKPLFFAPGFEDELKESYKATLKEGEIPDQRYLESVRQPWSVAMAKEIQRKYGFDARVDQAATEAVFKQKGEYAQVVHFASHAYADDADPMRSGIVLAHDYTEQGDGYLHVYEIFNLSLQSQLIVLGACETGVGELEEGEGVISLAYAMQYAGCPNTVMSLWEVDEKINTSQLKEFYSNLADNNTISNSLRQSKLSYLKDAIPSMSHPYYWAGNVLLGDDDLVVINQKSSLNYYMIVGALGGLLLLLLFLRKVRS